MKLRTLRTRLCLKAIVAAAAVVAVAGINPRTTDQLKPTLRRHRPADIHRVRDQTTSESYNWSGYAISGAKGSVTDVKGSWVVPTVTCANTRNGYASFWVGIDGWNSSTVEQIGTDSDCVNLLGTTTNTPTYYAWFEFYPNGAYLIGNYNRSGACISGCVFPGDKISAEVIASGSSPKGIRGGQAFTVTITDETRGWSFTTTSTVPNAQQSSAEWIAETPYGCRTASGYCQLSDFGSVYYGQGYTGVGDTAYATMNGVTKALGSFNSSVQEAVMVNYPSGTTTMAQPSYLDSTGTNFDVQWWNAGP